jgi:hypothetical protein
MSTYWERRFVFVGPRPPLDERDVDSIPEYYARLHDFTETDRLERPLEYAAKYATDVKNPHELRAALQAGANVDYFLIAKKCLNEGWQEGYRVALEFGADLFRPNEGGIRAIDHWYSMDEKSFEATLRTRGFRATRSGFSLLSGALTVADSFRVESLCEFGAGFATENLPFEWSIFVRDEDFKEVASVVARHRARRRAAVRALGERLESEDLVRTVARRFIEL